MTDDVRIELISPPTLHKPMGYSHLAKVNAGSLLLIAGQVALDVRGNIVGKDDVRAQTERIFENLKAAIESTGGSFRNIIKLNVYMIDISRLADYREVRDRYVDVRNPPASTAIQVAALVRPEFLIEVEAIASDNSG
jgi:enamine deaminase RidA (YjgF/YER057c/UK114 family)